MKNKTMIGVILLALSTSLIAQNNPTEFPTDARIKRVTFKENNVVPVNGMTFTTTQIKFGEQERILDIEGGDTTAWMVTYHPELPNMVFIKPTIFNSKTNMTIITNQHAYYFHLQSNKALDPDAKKQTYALKFIYENPVDTKNRKSTSVSSSIRTPKVVNSAYRYSGSPQLVPIHVFDDGKFTYFELSQQGSVPAIFAVDGQDGKESTVNTRTQGKFIVVQRLAPQFTLRQGGMVTSVFNTAEIQRIKANRRPA
jgi:type IV secretion system protein VirB9